MANQMEYDGDDRLITKFVGGAPGNETRFLQEVNYAYDRISRLLRINDPGTFGCNIGEEVCELSLELKLSKATLAAGHCRRLEAIKVDNLTYTLPSPLSLTDVGQAPAITAAIQQALDLFGLGGTANLVDIRNDADYFYFSSVVTGTQAGSMSWVLESCDQSPAYSSDCCIIAPISVPDTAPSSGLPFSTCADLYHQRMRYNGLDIANITLSSTCGARLVNNYTYDAMHRITAMHNTLIRPDVAAENAYSTSYSYDRAGNIQHLTRRGFVGMNGATPVYDLIDDLHYAYAGQAPDFSSVLQKVNDVVTDPEAQPRGVRLSGSGYGYDGNGNMTGAGAVMADYNILNLPKRLRASEGERFFGYVYGGGKYSAQLITGNSDLDETRHYIGGMEFKDGVLEAYNFGDGRVVWKNSVPKFQYRLHDHLGNTVVFFEDKNADGCIKTEDRATSEADLEIVQRLLYYPFGMALEGLGAWSTQPWQQYRYNGKERDTLTGWYEYGFRWGIMEIGRFVGVDPIADQFAHVSVYNYAENSPIGNIDLWGLQKFDVTTNSPGPNGTRGTTVRLKDANTSDGLQVKYFNIDQNGRRVRTNPPQDFFNDPNEQSAAATILDSYNNRYSQGEANSVSEEYLSGVFIPAPPTPTAQLAPPAPQTVSATIPMPQSLNSSVFGSNSDQLIRNIDGFINSIVNTLQENPALSITIFSETNVSAGTIVGRQNNPYIVRGVNSGSGPVGPLLTSRANIIQNRLIQGGVAPNRIVFALGYDAQSRTRVVFRRR